MPTVSEEVYSDLTRGNAEQAAQIAELAVENEALRFLIGAGVRVETGGLLTNFNRVMVLNGEKGLRILTLEAERAELLRAAREARAGHAGRLFGILDKADGKECDQ